MPLANAREVERTLGSVGDRPATRDSYSGSGVQPFRWLLCIRARTARDFRRSSSVRPTLFCADWRTETSADWRTRRGWTPIDDSCVILCVLVIYTC